MEASKVVCLQNALEQYLEIGSSWTGTRAAQGFEAVDRSCGEKVFLWVLRYTLPLGTPVERSTTSRMNHLLSTGAVTNRMRQVGIDPSGRIFLTLPWEQASSLLAVKGNLTQRVQLLQAITLQVGQVHRVGLACGDICPQSFIVPTSGSLYLASLLGVPNTNEFSIVAAEFQPYLAPEVLPREAVSATMAADVYALGVIGIELLGGKLLCSGEGMIILESLEIPQALKRLLASCLSHNPEDRPARADLLATLLRRVLQGQEDLELSAVDQFPEQVGASRALISLEQEDRSLQDLAATTNKKPIVQLRVAVLASLVLLLAIVLVVNVWRHPGVIELTGLPADNGQLVVEPNEALLNISVSEGEGEASELAQLVELDDPLAQYRLIELARSATSWSQRQEVEKALLGRAQRLGLVRSAEQVRQWLRGKSELPESYEAVCKLLDPSLPHVDREALLRLSYRVAPDFTLRFVASLAFDLNQMEVFQPIMAQLVGDAMGVVDVSEYSSLALVMSYEPLATVFSDEIVRYREELTDRDLNWLLPQLAARGDINTRALAHQALQRGILGGFRKLFMELVRDRRDLSARQLQALVKASSGILTIDDVAEFGRWYDLEAERVLLAIMADSQDEAVRVEAFDMVAGKNVTAEPQSSLIRWVRDVYWAQRSEFAQAIGRLSFLPDLSREQLVETLKLLESYLDEFNLLEALLNTGETRLLDTILDLYPNKVPLQYKLDLLRSEHLGIRRRAIETIDTNDVGALRLIVDAYRDESDPELKELYRQRFWVLQR